MTLWYKGKLSRRPSRLIAAMVMLVVAVLLCHPAMANGPLRSDPAKDAKLTADLKANLAADPDLRYAEIDVSVRNEVAYLFGILVRDIDPNRIVEAALDVPGIRSAVNYLNQTSILPLESDARVTRNIQHHLAFTPFGNTGDVVLTVQDGIAYLDGSVESWRGLAAAEDAAYAGGATTIVNRLKIQHPALPYSYRRDQVKDQLIQGR